MPRGRKKKPPDVSVVVVNRNSGELLKGCLNALKRQAGPVTHEVIVVDLNSTDGSRELAERHRPTVRMIANPRNVGPVRAANQGMAAAQARYILLLHPDTVAEIDALTRLVFFMDDRSDTAAAGGKSINPEGMLQESMRRFPTPANQIGQALFLDRMFPVEALSETVWDRRRYAEPAVVDWVSDVAFMVRKTALDEIGPLDEEFFMFLGVEDWCYRAGRSGCRVRYCPEARFMHYSVESFRGTDLYAHHLRSRNRFFEKHSGPKQAWLFKTLMQLNLRLRLSFLFGVTLLDRRSAAKDLFEVYWKGFILGS